MFQSERGTTRLPPGLSRQRSQADDSDPQAPPGIRVPGTAQGVATKYLDRYLRGLRQVGLVREASPRSCLAASMALGKLLQKHLESRRELLEQLDRPAL